jgi:ABC-type phosphate/phosphonate transport system substrate-binding protein
MMSEKPGKMPSATPLIAALPMYDWPERREDVDAEWAIIRDRLRNHGIDAPDVLTRQNADLPPVPGGIRKMNGELIAPDPATLPAGELDLAILWRHPALVFGQTCWGPMTNGLEAEVIVIGQPDYSGMEGCGGPCYSSVIVMRRADAPGGKACIAPESGQALIPLGCLRGSHFAFNSTGSLSGYLALLQDLNAIGDSIALFGSLMPTGSHRASIRAVASGAADCAAIDVRSWLLARRYEPAAQRLVPVGWTARRKGLPFIASRLLAAQILPLQQSL